MTSSSTITSALAVAVAVAAGCGATPDLTIDATRPDSTTALNIQICPEDVAVNSTSCTPPESLFGGTTDRERKADIFIEDSSTLVVAFLQTPGVPCLQVTVVFEGPVTLDYATGSATARCSPTQSCIPTQLMDDTCQ